MPGDAADGHRGDDPTETTEPEKTEPEPQAEPPPEKTEPGTPDASPEPVGPANEPERRPRRPLPAITLADYIELVRGMVEAETAPPAETPDRVRRWLERTNVLRKRQRAHGSESALRRWIADRTLQLRETPLPA